MLCIGLVKAFSGRGILANARFLFTAKALRYVRECGRVHAQLSSMVNSRAQNLIGDQVLLKASPNIPLKQIDTYTYTYSAQFLLKLQCQSNSQPPDLSRSKQESGHQRLSSEPGILWTHYQKISSHYRRKTICQTQETEILEKRFEFHKLIARQQKASRQPHMTSLLASSAPWRNDFAAPAASLQHAKPNATDLRIHNLGLETGTGTSDIRNQTGQCQRL